MLEVEALIMDEIQGDRRGTRFPEGVLFERSPADRTSFIFQYEDTITSFCHHLLEILPKSTEATECTGKIEL